MQHHTKLILASLTATLAMAIALTGTASARSFSFSRWNFRVVWTSLEFSNSTGFGAVRCPVTLEGSFVEATIAKVEKALIGRASRATIAEASCTGGRATVTQTSLPWHITYNGFRGRLPNINSIRLLLSGITFDIKSNLLAQTCHVTADTEHEARGESILNEATGEVENLVPDTAPNIPITGCAATSGRFQGGGADGTATVLGSTTIITIRLI
jgi:hypothetical protein